MFAFRETVVDLMRSTSEAAVERALEALSYWDDSEDAQLRPLMDLMKGGLKALAGDWDDAYQRCLAVTRAHDYVPMWGINVMATAAVWSRDLERVSVAAEVVDGGGFTGPYAAGLRSFLAGAESALNGDLASAAVGFEGALEAIGAHGTAYDLAAAQATYAALVGEGHPGALHAGRAAADWITATGAVRFIDTLAPGLPADVVTELESA